MHNLHHVMTNSDKLAQAALDGALYACGALAYWVPVFAKIQYVIWHLGHAFGMYTNTPMG